MSPERWKQVEEIFQSALDLSHEERGGFIARACAHDAELAAQVGALVEQYEQAGDFIEAPAVAVSPLRTVGGSLATAPDLELSEDPMTGRRVGSYRLVREIGRGGMGTVYLAERADSEYHKLVAVKVVKRGMDTDFILRRFRHERQLLATFDHPNIARLLDGGTTDEGLPYFVMEYVEGQPLYQYCDSRRLSVAERLRLFCQVCDSAAYAHQRMVVHRDIKPSNILVTDAGVPKLLDFGIAKLLDPDLVPEAVTPTGTMMRLMTPEYASPEQVQGLAVTPASDTYALGVVLYELLTGHRPYQFSNRSPHEIARVVCEAEPERPSRAFARREGALPVEGAGDDAAAALHFICETRSAAPESLRRDLEGNVDNIVLKALRKEPARRYPSADGLRADIARHLEGRPVSAPFYFPPAIKAAKPNGGDPESGGKSIAVLPMKLLDTRRGGDSTGDEFLGVGLADALITRLSQLQRFTLRPTSSVLRYCDNQIDPLTAGHELGVSYVLDGRIRRAGDSIRVTVQLLDVRTGAAIWAGQFDERFTDALLLEDAISSQVAEAIVPQLTRDERRQLAKRGTDDSDAFEAYLRGRYHWSTFTEEGFAKAIVCYYRAIALDPHYAIAYAGIADYYNWLGVYGVLPFAECSASAMEAARKAIEIDPALAEAHSALGFAVVCHDFDWAAAEAHHRRAIELNPNYATAHHWYSFQFQMEGRFDKALEEIYQAGRLDPLSPSIQQGRAWLLYQSRRYEESIAAHRKLLDAEPHFAYGHLTYSCALRAVGRHDESVAAAQKALEYAGESQLYLAWLGGAYAAAGRVAEAHEVLRRLGQMISHRYVSPYHLALIHCHLGDRELALSLLEEAYALRDAWVAWLGVEPQLDPLRSDPRFLDLLRRTNNPLAESHARAAGDAPLHTTGGSPAPEAAPPLTENAEAYQLFLAARYFERKRNAQGLREAISRYERAVEIDPRFAHAYAAAAECYALLNWYVEPPPPDAFAKAKEAAQRAVELDGELAEAHYSLGFVKLFYERDHAGAEAHFGRAIQLDPQNASARRWHSLNLSASGRHAEALAEIRRAQEISPRSAVIATAVANALYFARRQDEAIEQCHRALALDPGSIAAHVVLRWAYECKGMRDEAFAIYEKESAFAGDTPTTHAKHAHALAATGRAAEAREVLSQLIARREEEWVTPYEIAIIYSLLKDRDQAFAWLERAAREHAVGFAFVRVDPHLDNLRDDPRFDELLRRTEHAAPPAEPSTAPEARRPAHDSAPRPAHEAPARAAHDTAGQRDASRAASIQATADQRAVDVSADERPGAPARRRSPRAAVAAAALLFVLVAAAAIFLYTRGRTTNAPVAPPPGAAQPSAAGVRAVAVLPFKTVGADADGEYLGVGLADAVSNKLGQLDHVTTRPAGAVRRYLGSDKNPVEVGHELGADFVLTGTVERESDRVRTALELTDVAASRVLWSERLDELYTDVLALQSSVSERVARALDLQLTGDERARLRKRPTESAEAYALYLAGRYYFGKRTPEGLRQAISNFERAIEKDKNYAAAYAGLADCNALLNWYVEPPPPDAFAKAKEAAQRAVAIDDQLAEAHVSLAFVTFYYDHDLARAEQEFRRAVALNPNYPTAHHWFALVLAASGRHDEALAEVTRARDLDPRSAIISAAIANIYFYARRYDEAVAETRHALELDPGIVGIYTIQRWAYERKGMKDDALAAFERERAFAGDTPTTRLKHAHVLAAVGRADEARAVLNELLKRRDREWVTPHEIGVVYALLGDRDEAFTWLQRAAREHAIGVAFVKVDPQLDPLRDDPRFNELLRSAGLSG
ncbi:MAG TPA: protein kinase [Pyrinomonadaceae bacterium]|jgi:serine/threonine protein kinase/tetratricopeptide (TPR) repeat protein